MNTLRTLRGFLNRAAWTEGSKAVSILHAARQPHRCPGARRVPALRLGVLFCLPRVLPCKAALGGGSLEGPEAQRCRNSCQALSRKEGKGILPPLQCPFHLHSFRICVGGNSLFIDSILFVVVVVRFVFTAAQSKTGCEVHNSNDLLSYTISTLPQGGTWLSSRGLH